MRSGMDAVPAGAGAGWNLRRQTAQACTAAGATDACTDRPYSARNRREPSGRDDPHFLAGFLLDMIGSPDFERRRFHMSHRATARERQRWAEFAVDRFLRSFSAGDFSHSNL